MTCSKTDCESIGKISEVLKKGGIVILPTDTVYGFSGIVDLKGRKDFCCDDRIRLIKGRSETKPMIQLIAKPEDIRLYTDAFIDPVLLSKWPGPLTVIVPLKKDSPLKTELKSVAFRCPGDEWLRKIIENCGTPIYSTSVNRSGFPVLCTEKEILTEFEKDCDLIVLAGDTENALPSTIVKVEDGKPYEVVRQGVLKL